LELFVCRRDQLQIRCSDDVSVLHPGDAAIVPAFIPHYRMTERDDGSGTTISFSFRRQAARECQDLYSLLAPFLSVRHILVFHDAGELISCAFEIRQNCRSNYRFLLGLHLLFLLGKLSEEHRLVQRSEQLEAPIQDSKLVRFYRLDKIINIEYMRDLTAADIAQRLHICPRQLARIVRKRYNATLHQMISAKRMSVAVEMLRQSDVPVSKIVEATGFSSRTVFYHEFRAVFGMTPNEYRKRCEGDEVLQSGIYPK
jgi:AraC-like DNA-binding protein